MRVMLLRGHEQLPFPRPGRDSGRCALPELPGNESIRVENAAALWREAVDHANRM